MTLLKPLLGLLLCFLASEFRLANLDQEMKDMVSCDSGQFGSCFQ